MYIIITALTESTRESFLDDYLLASDLEVNPELKEHDSPNRNMELYHQLNSFYQDILDEAFEAFEHNSPYPLFLVYLKLSSMVDNHRLKLVVRAFKGLCDIGFIQHITDDEGEKRRMINEN